MHGLSPCLQELHDSGETVNDRTRLQGSSRFCKKCILRHGDCFYSDRTQRHDTVNSGSTGIGSVWLKG
ncbi:MAG TPA: hypothetical protein DCM44_06285 [Pantoea sp.]|nr:hypothetical protein [Pantoea sp.]